MPPDDATWLDRCPICASTQIRPLPAFERAFLSRCRSCKLVFARRRPSPAELAAYYENYGHDWNDSPITRTRYRELLDSFESARQTNRILDLGCGAGFFLEEARARGWETHGNELSQHAVEITRAKGLNVLAGPVTVDAFDPGYFDVVTAFEVFEHLQDPVGERTVLAHVLRPGGFLYGTTPNFNAASRRLLGDRWSVVAYPEHLHYFNATSLCNWLREEGFVPVRITSSGISLGRLKRSVVATDSPASDGQADERVRDAIEASAALRTAKDAVNRALALLGSGDTLKATFRLSQATAAG